MPPKNDTKRRPPNIKIGNQRPAELTFNDTSLQPFLRTYTRMNSRNQGGGGDRQFHSEFNLALRINHELASSIQALDLRESANISQNRWRNAPPEAIHNLVFSIAGPDPQPMYPTLRSQGVTDERAYENRIIITLLLMHHATNDVSDGRDGGETSGGLWLPPREPARAAQETALAQHQAVRYPTWYDRSKN